MQPYYYLHSLLFRLVNLSCLIANYECISYYIAWCYGYFFCSTGYFSVMLTSFVGSEIEATVSLRMVCAFFFLFFFNNEWYYFHTNQLKSLPDRLHHHHHANIAHIKMLSVFPLSASKNIGESKGGGRYIRKKIQAFKK